MNKTIIWILLAALALGCPACSPGRDTRPSDPASEESLERAPGGGRGPGRGAGLGPRDGRGAGQGLGRGLRRAWDDTALLRLTESEAKAVEIETAEVAYQPMTSHLRATGKVLDSPFRKAIVSYPFPARVAAIHVRPGDWVRSGQPLVTLQSEAVGEAKSEYFKARADFELAASARPCRGCFFRAICPAPRDPGAP